MRHKYPRTLNEAFGPYTDDYVYDDDPAQPWTFWLAVGTTVVLLTVIAVLLVC